MYRDRIGIIVGWACGTIYLLATAGCRHSDPIDIPAGFKRDVVTDGAGTTYQYALPPRFRRNMVSRLPANRDYASESSESIGIGVGTGMNEFQLELDKEEWEGEDVSHRFELRDGARFVYSVRSGRLHGVLKVEGFLFWRNGERQLALGYHGLENMDRLSLELIAIGKTVACVN